MQTPLRPKCISFDRTLQRTFGYNQFEVIGQSRKAFANRPGKLARVEQAFLACTSTRAAPFRDGYRAQSAVVSGSANVAGNRRDLEQEQPAGDQGPADRRRPVAAFARGAVTFKAYRSSASFAGAACDIRVSVALCRLSSLGTSLSSRRDCMHAEARFDFATTPGNCPKTSGQLNIRSASRRTSRNSPSPARKRSELHAEKPVTKHRAQRARDGDRLRLRSTARALPEKAIALDAERADANARLCLTSWRRVTTNWR